MTSTALTPEQAVFVLIDVQDRLAARMPEHAAWLDHRRCLLAGAPRLGQPARSRSAGVCRLNAAGYNVGRQAGGRRAAGLVARRNGQVARSTPGPAAPAARQRGPTESRNPRPEQGAAASAPFPCRVFWHGICEL